MPEQRLEFILIEVTSVGWIARLCILRYESSAVYEYLHVQSYRYHSVSLHIEPDRGVRDSDHNSSALGHCWLCRIVAMGLG
jgi:hypothetical protein